MNDREPEELRVSWWDRFLIGLAPKWGLDRVRARATAQLMSRHFEAAQPGRRTSGWQRFASDANVANAPALATLRGLSRDLRRNNGWAKRGIQAIVNNTVGWGILAKPTDRSRVRSQQALDVWNEWANTTACDFDGRLNFLGIQRLAMETIVESGEVIILRQPASSIDGLPIPMRLHVLEPDYLDNARNGLVGSEGGPIIEGIEFDKQGRRVAYWLFSSHPGGQRLQPQQSFASVRVPAERVLHIYRVDRPGQVRGVPWLASAIVRLKGLDDFEDAELMQQKVAACFGAFVTDMDGAAPAIGKPDPANPKLEELQPGHIAYLPPGKSIEFATPPPTSDSSFSQRGLRSVAASLGVTYEDLTGDYSQSNFSSARMGRLAHWQNVHEWREHMLIPQLCGGVWGWAMDLITAMEGWPTTPFAQWTAPPMPILEPDKEGLAYQRMIRNGLMTPQQAIRELGYDPTEQLEDIEAFFKELDRRGIVLDIDPRKMTQAGQMQSPPKQLSDGSAQDGTATDDATADDATAQTTH